MERRAVRDGGRTDGLRLGRHGVEMSDVTHQYGRLRALDSVSLDIRPGEFLTMLGPSGSGKTTLLRAIGGLVQPSSGVIKIDGHDVTGVPPQRRNLGFVFQNYALFPHLSLFDNVAFALRVRKLPKAEVRERVEAALALVQLEGLGDRQPSQLSGGQQQRVAVARAVVFEPVVLLLDEPLGALDRRLRQQLGRELRRIQRETHLTTIYVTHDQEEAFAMSDRVAVMQGGRIHQVAPPDEIYERPADLFVARFVGEINTISGSVVNTGARGLAVKSDQGTVIHSTRSSSAAERDRVVCAIRPEKVCVDDRRTRQPVGEATVELVSFQGSFSLLTLATPDGPLLSEQRAGGVNVHEGDRVRYGWDPDDVLILTDEP